MKQDAIRNTLQQGSRELMQLSPVAADTLLYISQFSNTASMAVKLSDAPDMQKRILDSRYQSKYTTSHSESNKRPSK